LINTNEGENSFVINENSGDVSCGITMAGAKAISHRITSKATVTIDRFMPMVEELSNFLSIESHHFLSPKYAPLLVASHVPYLFIPVDNVAALNRIHFDYKAWSASSAPGTFASSIFLFSASEYNGKTHFHCRLVGPNFGLHEDPPIGAAMPAFAAYIAEYNSTPTQFTAERGSFLGRKSELNVDIVSKEGNTVEVNISGQAVLVSKGELFN
jgi:trans-2,3-dihydro-3-hydroxyanthranilate isomerase